MPPQKEPEEGALKESLRKPVPTESVKTTLKENLEKAVPKKGLTRVVLKQGLE